MLALWMVLVADGRVAQWKARGAFEAASMAARLKSPPTAVTTPSVRPHAPVLHPGSVIGDLSVPRLELGAVVLHGSDADTLRRGPGHVENTALPGQSGNAVIAGHRDSFFRPLRDIAVGDDIFIDTGGVRLHYRVTSLRIVDQHDLSVIEQTDNAVLTLITCYPLQVLGPAPDRFVVRAALVPDSAPSAFAAARSTSDPPLAAAVGALTSGSQAAATDRPVAHDDATLVQQAIERFRQTYNARLISHKDMRPEGPLEWRSCDVAHSGDQVAATCVTRSPLSPVDDESQVWTLTLARVDRRWAIRSVQSAGEAAPGSGEHGGMAPSR